MIGKRLNRPQTPKSGGFNLISRNDERLRKRLYQFLTSRLQPLQWGLVAIALGLTSCNFTPSTVVPAALNSRYNDEQPALSGDGRWLAFVSNRNGSNQIAIYDTQQEQFVNLAGFSRGDVIAESPSLSRTGRYIVYIANLQGRPDIVLYDRETKRSEIVTQNYRSWVRNPYISSDGRYIVFETARRGQWDIEVYDRGPAIELDIPDGTPVENPPT
jgi:Tol biopolymer transport system component